MKDEDVFYYGAYTTENYLTRDTQVSVYERIELVENKGFLMYWIGGLYPSKGNPQVQAVAQNAIIKWVIKTWLYFPIIFLYKKDNILYQFNELGRKTIKPYLLKEKYMCPTTRGIFNMLKDIDEELALYISHIFEYDNAYRYYLQDIINETSEEKLQNPYKELKRLGKIFQDRCKNPVVRLKIKKMTMVAFLVVLIPKYRKLFKNAIEGNLETMRPDEEDLYWMAQREDYNFGGKTKEERMKSYTQYPMTFDKNSDIIKALTP